MKNKYITTVFIKGLLHIFIIGTSLMAMSFVNPKTEVNTYQIVSSKIFIASNDKSSDWKLTVNTSKFEGNFIIDGEQLEDIKDFRFSFPLTNSKTENQEATKNLKTSVEHINCGEITFSQKKIMILPIMKSIHIVGEIKIGNHTYTVPMQMQYSTNEDGSMVVYGKQFIKQSDLGISAPIVKPEEFEEELTINITLKLAKSNPILAKTRG